MVPPKFKEIGRSLLQRIKTGDLWKREWEKICRRWDSFKGNRGWIICSWPWKSRIKIIGMSFHDKWVENENKGWEIPKNEIMRELRRREKKGHWTETERRTQDIKWPFSFCNECKKVKAPCNIQYQGSISAGAHADVQQNLQVRALLRALTCTPVTDSLFIEIRKLFWLFAYIEYLK